MWREFSLLYNQNIDISMQARIYNDKLFKSAYQGL